jgi:hypothetical protein
LGLLFDGLSFADLGGPVDALADAVYFELESVAWSALLLHHLYDLAALFEFGHFFA